MSIKLIKVAESGTSGHPIVEGSEKLAGIKTDDFVKTAEIVGQPSVFLTFLIFRTFR